MKFSISKIVAVISFLFAFNAYPQPWQYDFGTGASVQWTSGSSTSFLPEPPSGAGTSRVTVGTGGGFFQLNNPGLNDFGTDVELEAVSADLSGSLNKFSIYGYSPNNLFTIKFDVRFSDAASGDWAFFQGAGPTFSNDTEPPGGQEVFTGIWWQLKGNDSIKTYYRTKQGWIPFTYDTLKARTNYTFEIYGNNTSLMQNYIYGSAQSVDSNKYDVWINGNLVLDDVSKDIIPDGTYINAFMFYGRNSRDNVSHIYLDNIFYANTVVTSPLPVELSSFTASFEGNKVKLNWITQSETNNFGFNIERSVDRKDWNTLGFIPGTGNSNSPKEYNYTDQTIDLNGQYFYRLKQMDADGKFDFSNILEVLFDLGLNNFTLFQNYPNPFNPATSIKFAFNELNKAKLVVYDILGNEVATLFNGVAEAGRVYRIEFDGANLSSGIYFYKLESSSSIQIRKMILAK